MNADEIMALAPRYDPVFRYNGHEMHIDLRDFDEVHRHGQLYDEFMQEWHSIQEREPDAFVQKDRLTDAVKLYYNRLLGKKKAKQLLGDSPTLDDALKLQKALHAHMKQCSPLKGVQGKILKSTMNRELKRRAKQDRKR